MVSGTTNSWELCDSALALFKEIFIYCEAYLVGTLRVQCPRRLLILKFSVEPSLAVKIFYRIRLKLLIFLISLFKRLTWVGTKPRSEG